MGKVAAVDEPAFRMSREDYRAPAEQQEAGRFERVNGVVVAMTPKRANHNLRKFRAAQVLDAAVRLGGLSRQVFTNGIAVEIGDSDYEPDAVLRCGAALPGDCVTVPDPPVVAEVFSPGTSATRRAWKLQEYFRLPSLRHDLIIPADKQQIVHHRRSDDGDIETRIVRGGEIGLDPPALRSWLKTSTRDFAMVPAT